MGQGRARHLVCKYHAVQDWTGQKRLKIEYVPTTRQVADALTKGGHSEAQQIKLTTGMGLVTAAPSEPEGTPVRGSAQAVGGSSKDTEREGINKAVTMAQPVRCKPTTRPSLPAHQGGNQNKEHHAQTKTLVSRGDEPDGDNPRCVSHEDPERIQNLRWQPR